MVGGGLCPRGFSYVSAAGGLIQALVGGLFITASSLTCGDRLLERCSAGESGALTCVAEYAQYIESWLLGQRQTRPSALRGTYSAVGPCPRQNAKRCLPMNAVVPAHLPSAPHPVAPQGQKTEVAAKVQNGEVNAVRRVGSEEEVPDSRLPICGEQHPRLPICGEQSPGEFQMTVNLRYKAGQGGSSLPDSPFWRWIQVLAALATIIGLGMTIARSFF